MIDKYALNICFKLTELNVEFTACSNVIWMVDYAIEIFFYVQMEDED